MADRYRLERELGAGGMATVYLARDLKHDRPVALKVLRPDLAQVLGAERFLREIRITANLQHPHILPLLDSGEAGGFLFYVMPYVEEGSLRQRLRRGQAPSREEVLALIRQVASALTYAHEQGIIHRDVKPENILLNRGEAVVADFGIARAVTSASSREALTRSGFPLGTPGYMSPEQAAGATRLDARTDVYGLACVAYEMLVGETPEMWPTEEAVRLGRLVDASASHRERLDRLPGRLEQALVRALAVRPRDRFATPLALADALAEAGPLARLPDRDVQIVLARAAQIEAGQPTGPGILTIGQVEQIAAEVGISPEHVRTALREQELARPAAAVPVYRAPVPATAGGAGQPKELIRVVRVVSREATRDELEALPPEIQADLGMAGHASVVGQSLVWSPAGREGRRRQPVVTVTGAGGQTEIRVEERVELSGDLFFVPPVGGAVGGLLGLMLGGILTGEPTPAILVLAVLGAFGGAIGMANAVVRILRKGWEPQLVALADRLAAVLDRRGPVP